ncbi:hypothetical protein SH2C18_14830 [Clostridium sediminicola]|uniref:hypothetical protein n=1 Tax=Clostridium sediminicola TaxID=3114879 RepID=UPI0031F28093
MSKRKILKTTPIVTLDKFPKLGVETVDNPRVQRAIDSISKGTLFLPPTTLYFDGSVTLKENVFVMGSGIGRTIIDLGLNKSVIPFTTPKPALKVLTQTNNLLIGDTKNIINNDLHEGDHITYRSTNRFTEEWDNGVSIRDYYTKGEIMKIVETAPTQLTFSEACHLDFPHINSKGTEAFTPTKNIGISDLTIGRNKDSKSYGVSVLIQYCDRAYVKNIESINTNDSGIKISKSRNVLVENCYIAGGSKKLGLNYGVVIIDGSKHVNLYNIHTTNCRHGIAGGGTGYANPMDLIADRLFIDHSQSHSLDTHGNCMNFTFLNAKIDKGLSLSGIGHIAKNILSKSGHFGPYEGGTDHSYENITYFNCTGTFTNKIVKRIQIKNFVVNNFNFTIKTRNSFE